ncbi:MAG: TetR/AcrR family transcriptional regulator [Solobacterium sp.]|nr:TetR/AcrR family transcriptional regulator [Solobacterium sp.]
MKTDGKAAQNKLKKRTSLMDAAFTLFTEEGFQNTTISQIANKAGIGKGTFYFYFEDKYDIRNKIIIAKSTEILNEALDILPKEQCSFEDKVILASDHIIDRLAADKILLRFVHKNLSWALLENNRELTETFRGILKHASEDAGVSYSDPVTMMYMIIELINSACYSPILFGTPLPLNELKPKLFSSVRAIMHTFETSASAE